MKANDKRIIKTEVMDYKKFKEEFAWNQTIDGSYDKKSNTIEVVMACETGYANDEEVLYK